MLASAGAARAQTDAPAPPPLTTPDTPPPDAPAPPTETPPPSRAPDDVPLIDLSQIETDNLRLLYFAPAETYLTPWVGRSFENALAFHERLFNWTPWDQTTVLLKDFSDYGNAAARSSPNNALL